VDDWLKRGNSMAPFNFKHLISEPRFKERRLPSRRLF
jgi:hypothetical protein